VYVYGTGNTDTLLTPILPHFLDNLACTRSIMINLRCGRLADVSRFEIDNAGEGGRGSLLFEYLTESRNRAYPFLIKDLKLRIFPSFDLIRCIEMSLIYPPLKLAMLVVVSSGWVRWQNLHQNRIIFLL
jgi:hypothetical protein